MKTLLKTLSQLVFIIVIIITILLGATREGRASVKSLLFIIHVFDQTVSPLEWFTPEPIIEHVSFKSSRGQLSGDIYRPPGKGPYAAVVLFLGVQPARASDQRVVNLGNALARSNMAAMYYWSSDMEQGIMTPKEIENLVASFKYLSNLEFVDPTRVGIAGFCVGGSFALIAASDPLINDDVQFVNAFGPYFDMKDLATSIISETSDGIYGQENWQPDKLSKKVLATHLTSEVIYKEANIITNWFTNDRANDIAPTLSTENGQRIHDLLAQKSRKNATVAFELLSPEKKAELHQLSPSSHVADIKASVLIMHDQNDPLIPVSHSRQLFEALDGQTNVLFTEYGSIFEHVSPNLKTSTNAISEMLRLAKHIQRIMIQST
ncbi:hypothetical protein FIM04_04560 [SAR202 cluster bacterium AC-409-J13_OGT_754m]|nr:hypothetical protein [SAR202 cluster bacterium AC-409-J13_OGT_754m]